MILCLGCTYEEADTQLLLYAYHAALHITQKKTLIKTVDTDVVVVLADLFRQRLLQDMNPG